MNTTLFKKLHALLNERGINEQARHDLVFAWTEGRTQSSLDLNDDELRDICFKLEHQYDAPAFDWHIETYCRKMRSQVLKIATETGIKETDSWVNFNRFMLNHSIFKKELKAYTLQELPELVRQFRGIERHYQQSAIHPGSKAWHHAHHLPEPAVN